MAGRLMLWVGSGLVLGCLLLAGLLGWILPRDAASVPKSPASARPPDEAPAPEQPQQADAQVIPLRGYITTDTWNWPDVPKGQVVCGGVPFQCEGAIRLTGLWGARRGNKHPGAVLGVPVRRQGAFVHLLQAAEYGWGPSNPRPYGKLVMHFAQGEPWSFYLLLGIHGLDWYGGPQTLEEQVADPNTRLGWYYQRRDGTYRRFFHTVLVNPRPRDEIVSVDFVSPLDGPGLWVFGLTLSDQAPPLAPPLQVPDLTPQRVLVTLRLVHASGAPALEASLAWQAIGPGFHIHFPPFPTDAEGRVVLDLPRGEVMQVAFTATASNGARASGSFGWDHTGSFPAELVVRLAREDSNGSWER